MIGFELGGFVQKQFTCVYCGRGNLMIGEGVGTDTSRSAQCFSCFADNDVRWRGHGLLSVEPVLEETDIPAEELLGKFF
jgi:hypothetical protein